jgi:excisionase family DNA binding protein
MDKDKLLTAQEVAKRLRVSERSVMRYIKAKKIRAIKIGQWRIKEVDLARFLSANSNKK